MGIRSLLHLVSVAIEDATLIGLKEACEGTQATFAEVGIEDAILSGLKPRRFTVGRTHEYVGIEDATLSGLKQRDPDEINKVCSSRKSKTRPLAD